MAWRETSLEHARDQLDETGKKLKIKVESGGNQTGVREPLGPESGRFVGRSETACCANKKVIAPGDSFSYLHFFEPTISSLRGDY